MQKGWDRVKKGGRGPQKHVASLCPDLTLPLVVRLNWLESCELTPLDKQPSSYSVSASQTHTHSLTHTQIKPGKKAPKLVLAAVDHDDAVVICEL